MGFTRDLGGNPIIVDAVKCNDSIGGYRVKVDDLVIFIVYDLAHGLSVSPVFGPADFNEKDDVMFFFDWEVKANIKPRVRDFSTSAVILCYQVMRIAHSRLLPSLKK
ncbi:hypothetical protein vBSsoS008_008 [Shigella phage vB_SsoS_008]|nr:hypothetical protein vBSsoS008_008 [Shigella phage vB_SsoS_008]